MSLDLFTGIPYGFEDFGRYKLYDGTTEGKTTVIYELCVCVSKIVFRTWYMFLIYSF